MAGWPNGVDPHWHGGSESVNEILILDMRNDATSMGKLIENPGVLAVTQ